MRFIKACPAASGASDAPRPATQSCMTSERSRDSTCSLVSIRGRNRTYDCRSEPRCTLWEVVEPAVESQATDRAYRIGQTKEVSVYLPILRDRASHVNI